MTGPAPSPSRLPTTRFAPAPTGRLHLGHLANAIYVWGLARRANGRVILRIEDHDRQRCRPEFEAALLDDLDRLGIAADEPSTDELRAGPSSFRQSDNMPVYEAALERLASATDVYACDCSRSTFTAWREENGRGWSGPGCAGGCHSRALEQRANVALRAALGDGEEAWEDLLVGTCSGPVAPDGDLPVRDRNGNWTYAFCVVVDDIRHGVGLVVRGEDLLDSTPAQIRLRRLLGRETPSTFAHHPLVRRPDGSKLSKADRDTAIADLLDGGASPEALVGEATSRVGLQDGPRPLAMADALGLVGASSIPGLAMIDRMARQLGPVTETDIEIASLASAEPAETARLADALGRIVPALEAFVRYEGSDQAARAAATWRSRLDQPLPEDGDGFEVVLRDLAEDIIPFGLRNGAPGFAGWVTTAPTTVGAAASLAGTVAGSQRWWVTPFNRLETVALGWLADLLGVPRGWQGTFTPGGSTANVIGLAAARQAAFEQLGIDSAREGLPPGAARVYASSEVHHVVVRAAGILGLGRRAVVHIPVDDHGRIALGVLRQTLEEDRSNGVVPVALIATAGTVNTGTVDPIAALADLADEFGTWLHVDGAYGLFGRLDERVAPLYDGLERAGSVVVDPHKWLAAPMGIGAVFIRDRGLLGRALTLEPAEYLEGAVLEPDAALTSPFDSFGDLYHDFNLDQSAPSRGVVVWALLREIGARGMRERVRRHLDFARRLADLVRADPRLELLAEPVLSICCFRYRAEGMDEAALDGLNIEVARRLRSETPFVPSTTRVAGRFGIRPCYINPRTTMLEVEGLAAAVRRLGDELTPSR